MGHENLKAYISNYYKQLFGHPEASTVALDESGFGDIPQLQVDENGILSTPFTEKEVFDAISKMKPNKAPGPDGFPAEFYKKCCILIRMILCLCFMISLMVILSCFI